MMSKYEIIKKRDAKALGLEYYYTGKLCKYGHDERRKVADGICPKCGMEYYERNKAQILYMAKKRYATSSPAAKERMATYHREYRRKNIDKIREQEKRRRFNDPDYKTKHAASSAVYYWENRERLLSISAAANRKKYAEDAEYREMCSIRAKKYYQANKERLKKQCNDYYHVTSILKKYIK